MCDASDYAVGAVLGQCLDKKPMAIFYTSKTLVKAQINYTTTEKELLAVVYALFVFVFIFYLCFAFNFTLIFSVCFDVYCCFSISSLGAKEKRTSKEEIQPQKNSTN